MYTRKIILWVSKAIVISSAFVYFVFGHPTIFPTGTTIYKPEECYNSYILVSDYASHGNHPSAKIRVKSEVPGDVHLVDMNGTVVHTWNVVPSNNKRCRLLPNGHLLYAGPEKMIYEYDWDGNIVWTHEGIGSINDMRWLPNNNRLLLAHEPLPEEYQKQVKDVGISPWWSPRSRPRSNKTRCCSGRSVNPPPRRG